VLATERDAVNKTFLITRPRGQISTLDANNPPVLLNLDTGARHLMQTRAEAA